MLREWEAAPVGNNPDRISLLPSRAAASRVVVNLMRRRWATRPVRIELPTAA